MFQSTSSLYKCKTTHSNSWKEIIVTHPVDAIQRDWLLPSRPPSTLVSYPSSFLHNRQRPLQNFLLAFVHGMDPRDRKLGKQHVPDLCGTPWSLPTHPNTISNEHSFQRKQLRKTLILRWLSRVLERLLLLSWVYRLWRCESLSYPKLCRGDQWNYW